ncbi:unnamed protein product [Linum trigynum]|uniref:Uncharacterized protein n=1 Tax=Linum trigynum TaxID=586398 RepID=A0AAV2F344_9ROSI
MVGYQGNSTVSLRAFADVYKEYKLNVADNIWREKTQQAAEACFANSTILLASVEDAQTAKKLTEFMVEGEKSCGFRLSSRLPEKEKMDVKEAAIKMNLSVGE